ncbi:uncharacterized protein [Setaria viridis]|uniref:uncharacterized protein n=1 Tax=Setaria viridis TaxID=4556 RepID=UPI0014939F42|nr:uncharacterized protein LOC117855436 isoform X1 [Setaria viridis]
MREPKVKPDATRLELEVAGALAGLKLKKAGKKTGVRIVNVLDDDDEVFLDEDLSLASSLRLKTKKRSPQKELRPEVVVATKDDKPDLVPAEPGKNIIKFSPKLSFVDASGASIKFLMELQNTVGTAGEPYNEPSMLLRVDPVLEGSALPQCVVDYKAFGTDLRENLLSVHAPGSGEVDDPLNPSLLWGSRDSFQVVGETMKAALGVAKTGISSEVSEEGEVAKEKEQIPQVPTRVKCFTQDDTQGSSFDPKEYEKSLQCYDLDHLARITTTLGYKAVIAGKVAVDRLREKEKAALSHSTKIIELEVEIVRLKKENTALNDLKTSLFEENTNLKKNK